MPRRTNKKGKNHNLGHLLQITNSALPIGGFSYSEGLEQLIEEKIICNSNELEFWIKDSLDYGIIRFEGCVLKRIYQACKNDDFNSLIFWDQWLLASMETEELRRQSVDMGRALQRLNSSLSDSKCGLDQERVILINYASVFGKTAADWNIPLDSALYGYLYRWISSILDVGVKLIPMGQSAGQKCLWNIQPFLENKVFELLSLPNEDLYVWNTAVVLASMQHETQYSRLYRS
ncbi:MAG: urease accessory protein UreF [Leptospirillum sp.]